MKGKVQKKEVKKAPMSKEMKVMQKGMKKGKC